MPASLTILMVFWIEVEYILKEKHVDSETTSLLIEHGDNGLLI